MLDKDLRLKGWSWSYHLKTPDQFEKNLTTNLTTPDGQASPPSVCHTCDGEACIIRLIDPVGTTKTTKPIDLQELFNKITSYNTFHLRPNYGRMYDKTSTAPAAPTTRRSDVDCPFLGNHLL
jgi:hypothetical protein